MSRNHRIFHMRQSKIAFLFFIFLSLFTSVCFAIPAHHSSKQPKKIHHRKWVHHRKSHAPKMHAAATSVNLQNAGLQLQAPSSNTSFLSTIENRLREFVHQSVTTLHYSAYKMGSAKIDTTRGVYIVDCSSYIDHILKIVYPEAYSSLVNWSGSGKPTSHDYYDFFTNLPSEKKYFWNKIDEVDQLRPGDILVFRYKNAHGIETGGHVMIVMDRPLADSNTFFIRVADAASGGHSEDTRLPHTSGIGIGTLSLKVKPSTYTPAAYAWSIGARWKNNVNFAMARPLPTDFTSST